MDNMPLSEQSAPNCPEQPQPFSRFSSSKVTDLYNLYFDHSTEQEDDVNIEGSRDISELAGTSSNNCAKITQESDQVTSKNSKSMVTGDKDDKHLIQHQIDTFWEGRRMLQSYMTWRSPSDRPNGKQTETDANSVDAIVKTEPPEYKSPIRYISWSETPPSHDRSRTYWHPQPGSSCKRLQYTDVSPVAKENRSPSTSGYTITDVRGNVPLKDENTGLQDVPTQSASNVSQALGTPVVNERLVLVKPHVNIGAKHMNIYIRPCIVRLTRLPALYNIDTNQKTSVGEDTQNNLNIRPKTGLARRRLYSDGIRRPSADLNVNNQRDASEIDTLQSALVSTCISRDTSPAVHIPRQPDASGARTLLTVQPVGSNVNVAQTDLDISGCSDFPEPSGTLVGIDVNTYCAENRNCAGVPVVLDNFLKDTAQEHCRDHGKQPDITRPCVVNLHRMATDTLTSVDLDRTHRLGPITEEFNAETPCSDVSVKTPILSTSSEATSMADITTGMTTNNTSQSASSATSESASIGADTMLVCKVCHFRTSTAYNLQRHINYIHGIEKEYNCKECAYKGKTRSALTRHVDNKHNVNRQLQRCEKCNYTTINQKMFKEHKCDRPKQRKEDMRLWKCKICNYVLTTKGSLKLHIDYMHRKEKPHACSECNYIAKTKSDITEHVQRNHSTGKTFSCTKCEYTTWTANRLQEHVRRVHTGRRLECPHCDFKANVNRDFEQHIIRWHPSENVYQCPDCKYYCNYHSDIKQHIRRVHKKKEADFSTYTICRA